jgi:hypothetical protein
VIGNDSAALRGERAGPVVWSGIIGVTCLLLVLLEHMLWLVLPFHLRHRHLLHPAGSDAAPDARRLHPQRRGHPDDRSCSSCSAGLLLVAVLSWSTEPGERGNWHQVGAHYLDGGVAFVRSTMALLESSSRCWPRCT